MKLKKLVSCLLACLTFTSCGVMKKETGDSLTASAQKQEMQITELNDEFRNSQMQFAVNLFQNTCAESPDKNALIAPLSVMLALSMTANGAKEETKSQMEMVLGRNLDFLNQELYSYVNTLPSSKKAKFSTGNSIWIKNTDGFSVNSEFLQTDVDYYNAELYLEDFNKS